MADEHIDQVLPAQSVSVVDCRSIMETVIEKITVCHNVAIEQISKNINRLIAKRGK